jgi:monofunctional glycosyltransferase
LSRSGAWLWARRLALVVIAILAVPYVLTPFYRLIDPPSTLILARRLTGQPVRQAWMPLGRISPALPAAVLVAEDARFCSHHGVDLDEIRDAIEDADELGDMRGGSTITQQVVKNLFLWPGRSVVRKALELPLALWFDLVVPKRRIVEIYLNIAEWGPRGEFGAEAGARRAFGRSAADLSPPEAALMAAMLPNPRRRDARNPGPGVRRLAGIYRGRAARAATALACLRGPAP